jgi:hypothetical protein
MVFAAALAVGYPAFAQAAQKQDSKDESRKATITRLDVKKGTITLKIKGEGASFRIGNFVLAIHRKGKLVELRTIDPKKEAARKPRDR